jgi:hypothetical protein
MDLSPITFAHWQRDARRTVRQSARAEATASTEFARVEVVPVAARAREVTSPGVDAMRLVVRRAAGHEAALDSVRSRDGDSRCRARLGSAAMIGFGGGRAIFLATGTTDLCKTFTGLYALVREPLAQEPLSGAVFAFCNRRATP